MPLGILLGGMWFNWCRLMAAEKFRLQNELKQLTNQSIANKLGLNKRCIDHIVSGKTWRHVV